MNLIENLMEGTGVVHVHGTHVPNPMQDISENTIPALRLKSMHLYATKRELKLEEFNEKAQSLLRSCCVGTLEKLWLDTLSTMLFMSYTIKTRMSMNLTSKSTTKN